MGEEPHQNLAIIGHVGQAKSTLVDRLLYETGSVPDHGIEQYRKEAEEKGKGGFEFAYVMDAVVTVHPQKPLSSEPSEEIAELGSFAVRDMDQIIVEGPQRDRTRVIAR